MKCTACGIKFPANLHTCAPGGYSAPGVFFVINVVLLISLLGCLALGYILMTIPVGLILLIALGANLTSWTDSNCEMGSKGERVSGLSCPKCKTRHRVYPWSF